MIFLRELIIKMKKEYIF